MSRGEYDPATTKVLHLKQNPERAAVAAAKQKQLTVLKDENELLRQRIMVLESGAAFSQEAPLVPTPENSVAALENISQLLETQETVAAVLSLFPLQDPAAFLSHFLSGSQADCTARSREEVATAPPAG